MCSMCEIVLFSWTMKLCVSCSCQVYSVDNEEQSGGSLEFVVPRDLADGFINNKRESYRFRWKMKLLILHEFGVTSTIKEVAVQNFEAIAWHWHLCKAELLTVSCSHSSVLRTLDISQHCQKPYLMHMHTPHCSQSPDYWFTAPDHNLQFASQFSFFFFSFALASDNLFVPHLTIACMPPADLTNTLVQTQWDLHCCVSCMPVTHHRNGCPFTWFDLTSQLTFAQFNYGIVNLFQF